MIEDISLSSSWSMTNGVGTEYRWSQGLLSSRLIFSKALGKNGMNNEQ
jgi:hypothetical protein